MIPLLDSEIYISIDEGGPMEPCWYDKVHSALADHIGEKDRNPSMTTLSGRNCR